MKFANFKFNARSVNNLGDNMQLIAIDWIYGQMGVPKEDIVYIDKNELSSYRGEYVVLPVSMPLVDYCDNGIAGRFSDHIIPVFLGLTLVKDSLLPQEVDYYRRFAPIGCRDERTLKTLRGYGINAYLHGCITAALPRREVKGKEFGKVFIVDAPEEIFPFIPESIRDRSVVTTHIYDKMTNDPKDEMLRRYEMYKNEAQLVITSLLHCSVPCMAAGIPVVLVKTQVSYRFAWLERLLPVYEPSGFAQIDWNPGLLDYEDHKSKLFQLTTSRIMDSFEKYRQILDLSWFYEERKAKKYVIDAFEPVKRFIDANFTNPEGAYKYSIWGVTQTAELTVQYIKKRFPNAELIHVYDTFRALSFEGRSSEPPDNIRVNRDDTVFVTAIGATPMAEKIFDEIDKPANSYAFLDIIR